MGRHEQNRENGIPASQLIDEAKTQEAYTQFDEQTRAEIAQNVLKEAIEKT